MFLLLILAYEIISIPFKIIAITKNRIIPIRISDLGIQQLAIKYRDPSYDGLAEPMRKIHWNYSTSSIDDGLGCTVPMLRSLLGKSTSRKFRA
jgi:hypothetical protein